MSIGDVAEGACHYPPNGRRCVRDEELDSLQRDTTTQRIELDRFKGRVTDEFFGVFGEVSKNTRAIDALAEKVDDIQLVVRSIARGVEVGMVRATQISEAEWLNEPTGVVDVHEWAVRARGSESKAQVEAARVEALRVENAALQARLEERTRQSDRVRAHHEADTRIGLERWKLVVGAIVAVATGGGIVLLERLVMR